MEWNKGNKYAGNCYTAELVALSKTAYLSDLGVFFFFIVWDKEICSYTIPCFPANMFSLM